MEARFVALETILPTLATKTAMADVRGDLHKMDASIKAWMVATIIGLFLGFSGLVFTAFTGLKPPAQAAAQAPIVIQVPAQAAAPPALSASR